MKRRPLRVLMAEDNPHEAELVLRELARASLEFESRRVQTEADFRRELAEFQPDLVLSDFSMPAFSGPRALEIVQELGLDLPLIFVSGTIGEEVAVEAMKAGGSDYVMKANLVRLGPAIERELRDAEARKARRTAEAGLRRAQAMAKLAHVVTGPDGAFESWSETLPELAGVSPDELPRSMRAWPILVHPEDRARFHDTALDTALTGQRRQLEYRLQRPDGRVIHVRQTLEPLEDAGDSKEQARWFNTLQDVTDEVRTGEELRQLKLAMENSADMVILIDRASMRHVYVNSTACRLLGYSKEELLAMGPMDTLPATRESLEKAYDELIADSSQPSGMNSYYRCKDGSRLPFESTRRVIRSGDQWLIVAISRDIRERLAAERAVRDTEAKFRQTFELAATGIARVGPDRRFLQVNRRLCEMLGYPENELIGRSVKEISHPEDRDVTDERAGLVRAGKLPSATFEKRYLRKNGSVIWVTLTLAVVRDTEGQPEYAIAVLDDITERKAAQERVGRLTRVHAVLSGINGAIVRIRDRQELLNEACRIAEHAGRFPVVWLGLVDREAQRIRPVAWNAQAKDFLRAIEARLSIAEGTVSPGAIAVTDKRPFISNDVEGDPLVRLKQEHRDLGVRSMAMLPLLVSGEAVGVLGLHATEIGFFDGEEMKLLEELAGDISFALEHIQKSEQIEYLAYYDSLTGLANRTLFYERLRQYLEEARKNKSACALIFLDIERFKTVNDSLGRRVGDALLTQIVERIKQRSDPGRLARIGADQFAIAVPDMQSVEALIRRHETRMEEVFGAPFRADGHELHVAAKAGIAVFPADGTDADSLFTNAEAALKKAKASGERYLFYAQQMTERVAEKLALENKLRRALEKDEFVLHYQPKVDLERRAIIGVEALIRWNSPELGLVPPMKFIPLLEETGLILEVGAWALRRASRDYRRWLGAGLKPPRVAVNVSAVQLRQRDFVASLERAILEGGVAAGIDLEITESLIMEDIQATIAKLREVRKLGLGVAIDDFGTGYSSLAYLARLPIDTIKIDRSFIVAMMQDADATALIQMLISLAHSLRLSIVAEGVETEDQAKLLRLFRCDAIQGYLISRPVPEEELGRLLTAKNREEVL